MKKPLIAAVLSILAGSSLAAESSDVMWSMPYGSIPGGIVITQRPVPAEVSAAVPACRDGNGRLARDWVHDTTKGLAGCWRVVGNDIRIDWPNETKFFPRSVFTQVNP